ncbi:MAG: hypothetical protein IJ437_01685 [Clostridia bacterium]|nr:hypothetical protein [Clostridia bacterium]
MAQTKKLYNYALSGGISKSEADNLASASLVKNMINVNGINKKRQGHESLCQITDNDLVGMKINGIYNYFYVESDGTFKSERIVHAKDKLFRTDSEFSSVQEIALGEGIVIKDAPSRAFPMGKYLWIIGAGDLLLYDGTMITRASSHENAYIPDTSTIDGTTKKEYPNVLTQKRINRFVGTSKYRDTGEANVFLLDDRFRNTSPFLLEIKFLTRTSEEGASPEATYIGVDAEGVEVDRLVTVRFNRERVRDGALYFVKEPIVDEDGNIINIKIDGTVYTYDQLPFSIRVRNGREILVMFDITAPNPSEPNVYVKYEAERDSELMNDAQIATVTNGDKGGQVLLLNFGDNKIYFTDEENGFFYLPSKNKITLGSDGEKITAMIKLSENLVGVFKENSFYRIKFTSSNEEGYEIFSSSDSIGAYSPYSSCVVDYDCLVFNDMGVFGVSEYKSTANAFYCLRRRSTKINSMLEGYSREERENAKAISFNARYYLFIAGDVYIADTRRKFKDSSLNSDAFEYEWWLWDNCQASALYTDGLNLYFGTENGQIRKFIDSFCDIDREIYSENELSLLLNEYDTYTEFVIPSHKALALENAKAYLSPHRYLISTRAVYENGALYFGEEDLFSKDGSVKIFEGDILEAYDKTGTLISQFEIKSMDIVYSSVMIESADAFNNGNAYDVYLYRANGYEYDIERSEMGVILLYQGERIRVLGESGFSLALEEKTPIECVYKTNILSFDAPAKKKNLYKLFLRLSDDTEGVAEVMLETERAKIKKAISSEKQMSLDTLSFDKLSLGSPFKISYPLSMFLRNFENISLEIKSTSTKAFGLEGVDFVYSLK